MPNTVLEAGLPVRLLSYQELKADGGTHRHWHADLEIFVPLEGSLPAWIDGRGYVFRENFDVAVVNSGSVHSFGGLAEEDPERCLVLQISCPFLRAMFPAFDAVWFEQPDWEFSRRLREDILALSAALKDPGPFAGLRQESLLLSILHTLFAELQEQPAQTDLPVVREGLSFSEHVQLYLQNRQPGELSFGQLIRELGLRDENGQVACPPDLYNQVRRCLIQASQDAASLH